MNGHEHDTGVRTPPQRVEGIALADSADPLAQGRAFTRETLRGWAEDGRDAAEEKPTLSELAVADVLLLVSELLSNAMRHGGGVRDLVLSSWTGLLRVEVTDPSPTAPATRRDRAPDQPGGHGLLIVDRLSQRWGSTPLPSGGKCVWLELPLPA